MAALARSFTDGEVAHFLQQGRAGLQCEGRRGVLAESLATHGLQVSQRAALQQMKASAPRRNRPQALAGVRRQPTAKPTFVRACLGPRRRNDPRRIVPQPPEPWQLVDGQSAVGSPGTELEFAL